MSKMQPSLEDAFEREMSPSLESIICWIQTHLEPDDVFSEEILREWAIANGFVELGTCGNLCANK